MRSAGKRREERVCERRGEHAGDEGDTPRDISAHGAQHSGHDPADAGDASEREHQRHAREPDERAADEGRVRRERIPVE
jgi:hypothetical protein